MEIELIIAVIATIALILPAFERLTFTKEEPGVSKTKRLAIFGVILTALALNISLTWVQFANVKFATLKRQKALERELAGNAWAFSEGGEQALKDLTSLGTTAINLFLLGYYQFRQNEPEQAKQTFREVIRRGEFVAAANYFLAVIDTNDDNDLEYAKKNVSDGLKYDPDFDSLYLIRAIIAAKQHEKGAALKGLREALDRSTRHCSTMSEATRDPSQPLYVLRNEDDFQNMLKRCNELNKGQEVAQSKKT